MLTLTQAQPEHDGVHTHSRAGVEVAPRAFVEPEARIGARVTLAHGAVIPAGAVLEDDVTVGANAVLLTEAGESAGSSSKHVVLRSGSRVGAGAVVLPGVTVGQHAVVAPGAVVTLDVPPHAFVSGNPAQVTDYVTSPRQGPERPEVLPVVVEQDVERVGGARMIRFAGVQDMRGRLAFAQVDGGLPFVPQRVFHVYDVPSSRLRGEHAHRECEQLLICVKGQLSVVVDNGSSRAEVVLDDPRNALYLPPMLWGTQYKFSLDAVLLVLASHAYEAADYIRDYDEYLLELAKVS